MSARCRGPRLPALLLAGTFAAATVGCVGPPAATLAGVVEKSDCPVAPSDYDGDVRFAHLGSAGPESYIIDRGLAEACLPEASVTWTRYPTGQDIVQSFAAGSSDIGLLGSTPTAKALSEPLDLPLDVTGVNSVIGTSEALVARDAASPADLRGRRIGVPYSSTSHYSLLKVLEAEGLDYRTDVELVNLSPDKLPAAWESGGVDAAYVWNPTLDELVAAGGTVLVDSAEVGAAGSPTFNITAAERGFRQEAPDVLRLWGDLRDWAVRQSEEDPEGFVTSVAAETGLPVESARRQLEGLRFVPAADQPAELDRVAVALHDTAEAPASAADRKDHER